MYLKISYRINASQRNFNKKITEFSISIIPADGLALLGARTSAVNDNQS